jgi:hypothetical protein
MSREISPQNSNLPTKQNSNITSQITFGVVGNWVYDNIIKAGVQSMTPVITFYLGILRGLDWLWIFLLSLLAVFLVTLSLNFIDLWRNRRKKLPINTDDNAPKDNLDNPKTNEVIEDLRIEVQTLKYLDETNKAEIERLTADCEDKQRDIISFQKRHEADIQILKSDLNIRDKKLSENQLPIVLAEVQRNNINDYVILESFYFCRIDTHRLPKGIFVMRIRNNSIFTVELEKEINGEIWFDNLELQGKKRFGHLSPRSVKALDFEEITLEVQISTDELKYMNERLAVLNENLPLVSQFNYEKLFRIDDLEFTIKGVKDDFCIISKKLKIKQPNGRLFKVINRDNYTKALESFEQF